MKFKSSITLLAPLCATLILAGCGSKTEIPDKDDNKDPEIDNPVNPNPDQGGDKDPVVPEGKGFIKEPTTIVLKTTAGQQSQPILERFVKSFKEVEPNVTVKLEYPGGGYAGIAKTTLEEFQTNLHGDLVMMYPDAIADCIDYGFAYDLDPYINNPEYGLSANDKNDYISTYMSEGTKYVIPGTYSLPFSKSTEAMFYDADKLIGKVIPGVNGDKGITAAYMNSLTWEKLFTEFCPAVVAYTETEAGKNFIDKTGEKGWGVIGYDSDANLFITLCEQYGFPYTSVDTNSGTGSIDFYKKDGSEMRMVDKMVEFAGYNKKHYIFTNSTIDERPNNLFTKDQCLLSIGSTAGIKYQFDEKDPRRVFAAPIPQADGKDRKVISQGPSMAFLAHKDKNDNWDENRKLASWLFYKHMTTPANAADWAINANYMPIRSSIFKTKAWERVADPNAKGTEPKSLKALFARVNVLVANTAQEDYYTSPAFKGSNTSRQQVDALVGKCFNSDGTKDAIKKLFDEAYNKILL